jgi:hypothetical protein
MEKNKVILAMIVSVIVYKILSVVILKEEFTSQLLISYSLIAVLTHVIVEWLKENLSFI